MVGYVPDVDVLPVDAERLGLRRRCAFVLESYRSDCVDMYFDHPLYRAIVESVAQELSCMAAFPAASGGYLALGEADWDRLGESGEPFAEVALRRGDSTVALLVSEPWAMVGGPGPYHDSYTVAVFHECGEPSVLERAIRDGAARVGAVVTETVMGQELPSARGLIARLTNSSEPRRQFAHARFLTDAVPLVGAIILPAAVFVRFELGFAFVALVFGSMWVGSVWLASLPCPHCGRTWRDDRGFRWPLSPIFCRECNRRIL